MKVLLCGLCIFFTAVSAFHSTNKRSNLTQLEGGPDHDVDCTDSNECWRLYKPVNRVVRDPSFNVLIGKDERMELDCSNSTLTEAGDCGDDVSFCTRSFSKTSLYLAWDHFCQYKEEFERLQACWNSPTLEMVISSCAMPVVDDDDPINRMPECIEKSVTSMVECGEAGGRLLRELIDKLVCESFKPRHLSF